MILNEEQLELKAMMRNFADKEIRPVAAECDKTGEFPMELYKRYAIWGSTALICRQNTAVPA